ncbi:amidohydrolase family protein [Variovorax ureilyticus]|uniref:Amidohydrolase family protein n=1 Tax=Variovorax ureilyticus TaxID=1836198 RepID=A0ABU8VSX0_9BURK
MHLFDPALPFASSSVLKHGRASVDDYRGLQCRLRLERCVLVQPSSYGLDHRVLLAGLKAMGDSARGVAVVDPSFTRADLGALNAQGVVGARFNLVQAGATHVDMLEPVANAVAEFGWHLQLHAHPERLIELAPRLQALPLPVVIDHLARLNVTPALRRDVVAVVRSLVANGKTWLKLSAPYIASPGSHDYADLDELVQCLANGHIDRLVWGSDWPHVTEALKPDDAALMNLLARWFGAEQREQILVHNATSLYSFDR